MSFVLVGSAGAAALLVAVVPQDTTVWPGDRNQHPAPGGDGKSVSLPARPWGATAGIRGVRLRVRPFP